jgi:hypothetical protein
MVQRVGRPRHTVSICVLAQDQDNAGRASRTRYRFRKDSLNPQISHFNLKSEIWNWVAGKARTVFICG